MRISDWSSDVCSSDLPGPGREAGVGGEGPALREKPKPHPELRATLSRCAGEGLPSVATRFSDTPETPPSPPPAAACRTGARRCRCCGRGCRGGCRCARVPGPGRSEEDTSELKLLMRI